MHRNDTKSNLKHLLDVSYNGVGLGGRVSPLPAPTLSISAILCWTVSFSLVDIFAYTQACTAPPTWDRPWHCQSTMSFRRWCQINALYCAARCRMEINILHLTYTLHWSLINAADDTCQGLYAWCGHVYDCCLTAMHIHPIWSQLFGWKEPLNRCLPSP